MNPRERRQKDQGGRQRDRRKARKDPGKGSQSLTLNLQVTRLPWERLRPQSPVRWDSPKLIGGTGAAYTGTVAGCFPNTIIFLYTNIHSSMIHNS